MSENWCLQSRCSKDTTCLGLFPCGLCLAHLGWSLFLGLSVGVVQSTFLSSCSREIEFFYCGHYEVNINFHQKMINFLQTRPVSLLIGLYSWSPEHDWHTADAQGLFFQLKNKIKLCFWPSDTSSFKLKNFENWKLMSLGSVELGGMFGLAEKGCPNTWVWMLWQALADCMGSTGSSQCLLSHALYNPCHLFVGSLWPLKEFQLFEMSLSLCLREAPTYTESTTQALVFSSTFSLASQMPALAWPAWPGQCQGQKIYPGLPHR